KFKRFFNLTSGLNFGEYYRLVETGGFYNIENSDSLVKFDSNSLIRIKEIKPNYSYVIDIYSQYVDVDSYINFEYSQKTGRIYPDQCAYCENNIDYFLTELIISSKIVQIVFLLSFVFCSLLIIGFSGDADPPSPVILTPLQG
ncbi:MAG: hypothetical protein WCP85_31335, partial [Mariniphaga sp.]